MALPSNVGFGTVVGRFLDSEGTPITGQFTFTPSPKNLKNIAALPSPVTILPKPVVATLDGTGSLSTTLIATDDPDNNPSDWTYTVSFSSQQAKIDPFSITVPEGSTQDLTVLAPVAASAGNAIVRGPGVDAGGTTGQILAKASAADYDTEWIDAPTGGATDATAVTFTSGAGIVATNVAGALDELKGDIGAIDTTVTAPEVGFTSGAGLVSTDVGAALDELATDVSGRLAASSADVTLADPTAEHFVHVDITDDQTATAGWPDRLAFYFTPFGGARTRTGYHNEYGELRARPAKASTVAFRAMGHAGAAAAQPVFEVTDSAKTTTYLSVAGDAAAFAVPISAPNLGVQITDATDVPFASGAGLTSVNAGAALDELAGDIGALTAPDIGFTSGAGLASVEVGGALDELAGMIGVKIEGILASGANPPGGTPAGTIYLIRP